jgi:hypothetical protein
VTRRSNPELLTTGAAGRALGLTAARIRQKVLAGELPAVRVGDRFVVPTEAVEAERGRRDARRADREHERGANAAAKADRAFARAARAEGREPNDPRYRQMGKPARALCAGRGGSR